MPGQKRKAGPHECEACGQRFTTEGNLSRHGGSTCPMRGEDSPPRSTARHSQESELQGPALVHTPPSEPVTPIGPGPFSQPASWGQGNSAAMPPPPRHMPLAMQPSLYPTNTHTRVPVSPSAPPAPFLPPAAPQDGTQMQNRSPAIVNPPRLPVVAHEPPNNGGGQGPGPWSAINLRPKPSAEGLQVGHSIIATTEGPLKMTARFDLRGSGPLVMGHMPNVCRETLLAVRRGVYAALWCLGDIIKHYELEDVQTPLHLSQSLQHCTVHVGPEVPELRPFGSSIGLATALSVLSLCLGRRSAHVAATGRVYLDGTLADVLGLREKGDHLAGSDWHSLIIPSKNKPEPCPVQLLPAPTVTGASFYAFAFGNPFWAFTETPLCSLMNANLATMTAGKHTTVEGKHEEPSERFWLPRGQCKTFTCHRLPLRLEPTADQTSEDSNARATAEMFAGGMVTSTAVMLWEGSGGVTVLPQVEQEVWPGQASLAIEYLQAHRHKLPCAKPGMDTWRGLEVVVDVVGVEGTYSLGLDDGGPILVSLFSAYTGVPIKNQARTVVLVGLQDEHGSLLNGFDPVDVAHGDALVTQLLGEGVDTLIVGAGAAHSLRSAVGQRNLTVLGVHTVDELLYFTLPQLVPTPPLIVSCGSAQLDIFELPPAQDAEARREQLLAAAENGVGQLQRVEGAHLDVRGTKAWNLRASIVKEVEEEEATDGREAALAGGTELAFAFLQRMSVMFHQAEDGHVYMLLEDTRGKAFLLAPKDPMGGVRLYSLAALVSGLFIGDVDFRGHDLYGLQLMRPKEAIGKYEQHYSDYHSTEPDKSFLEWSLEADSMRTQWTTMHRDSLPPSAVLSRALTPYLR